RAAALIQLADAQEHRLGAKRAAFSTLCQALGENPTDGALLPRLVTVADELDCHAQLASTCREAFDALPRGPLAEGAYLKLAELCDEKIDDLQSASEALYKILEFDPVS